jgi:hypothetical protein
MENPLRNLLRFLLNVGVQLKKGQDAEIRQQQRMEDVIYTNYLKYYNL